jgi:two-component system, cell cycle sensor histidine kinase and response regulator CckA
MPKQDKSPEPAILEQIFRDAPLPLAIYNLAGELTHSNDAHDAFAEALGDAAGIGSFNALYDLRSKRGGHYEQFRRAVGGAVLDYAFSVKPSDEAEAQHFRRVLLPAYDGQRKPMGVVSVIVDVSEWLQAERDKSRLQAELQQAQKTEALGLLAGSIAHDFNNLLVGVLGNVSLLLESLAADSPLRRLAHAAELAAQRAADVARQLLAYAGKGQFRVEQLDLSELVRETSELLRITVAHGAELHLQTKPHIAKVKADATQMRQVVMNLFTNARDAVGNQGSITVRTGELAAGELVLAEYLNQPDPDAKRFVFLEVEDTGQGMSAATAARIFDPFFSTRPSGRGLGLSAVLGIIRSHGGAMSVRSSEGRGTTMRVLLPATSHLTVHPKLRLPKDAAAVRERSGGQVLVVDDQEAVRTMLGQLLPRLGYSVTQAANGNEALRALEHEAASASCVLLDLSMPAEDGSQIAQRISERHPELPIVFMSGYEAQSVPVADGFLHKPFTLEELRTTLSSVITRTAP